MGEEEPSSTTTPSSQPLIHRRRKDYSRVLSHARDELSSFRSYLRWMCVDQSNCWTACLSWAMFVGLTFVVPAFSHFVLACSTCDSKHKRPYDAVIQLSMSSIATLSFLCLTAFVRKYGLRRFLFFDKLVDESDSVRQNYTDQLNRSLKLVSYFTFPCFLAECAYKIWWYASGASQIPFLGNVVVSDTVACFLELSSWLYRSTVFFLLCVLFRLMCYLQILRLQDFAKVFSVDSDVAEVLSEHLRIRRHLRIISHRFRAFILISLILITISQFTSLLLTTKSSAVVNIYRAGELALCSMTLIAGLMIMLRCATKITHKAQAITCLAAKWHVCATIDSFTHSADAETPIISQYNPNNLAPFSEGGSPTSYNNYHQVVTDSEGEDAGDEEDDVDNTKMLPAYAYSTLSFQKRQALEHSDSILLTMTTQSSTASAIGEKITPKPSNSASVGTTAEEAMKMVATPLNQLITCKLEDDNYLTWKFQVEYAIAGYGLEGYIYGTQEIPDKELIDEEGKVISNPAYTAYVRQDKLLVSWLLSSIAPTYIPQLIGCKNSHEVWSTIAQQFASQSTAKVMLYKRQLENTKKDGLSMKDYLGKIKTLVDLLGEAGHKLTETDHVLAILNGLGDEYEAIVAVIASRETPHSLQTVGNLLLAHEGRINQKISSQMNVNMVQAHNPGSNNASFSGNRGHWRTGNRGGTQGSSRGGPHGNRGRGRGRNTTRPQCQLCGKMGHTVHKCYYRFDVSFTGFNASNTQGGGSTSDGLQTQVQSSANLAHDQPTTTNSSDFGNQALQHSASADFSSWFPDSGATHHLTNDLNNLSFGTEFSGPTHQGGTA